MGSSTDETSGGGHTGGSEADRLDEAFRRLWQALVDAGHPVNRQFWWFLRASDGTDAVELVCCRRVHSPIPRYRSSPHWTVECGTLAAGVELVVRWRRGNGMTELGEGVPSTAFSVALIEAERRDVEWVVSRVRQPPRIEGGEPTGYELPVPLGR